MVKHNVLGNRKPQPGALHAANSFIVNLLEFVKYLLMIFDRYSDARVRYANFHKRIDVINTLLLQRNMRNTGRLYFVVCYRYNAA